MFKKTLISGLIIAAFAASGARAQNAPASPDKPAEPPPEFTITGNVGFFSQYIFRGLTQTNRQPALQGGFDVAHKSGAYLGTWASNIAWLKDSGQYSDGGSLEWDFYGGYKTELMFGPDASVMPGRLGNGSDLAGLTTRAERDGDRDEEGEERVGRRVHCQ